MYTASIKFCQSYIPYNPLGLHQLTCAGRARPSCCFSRLFGSMRRHSRKKPRPYWIMTAGATSKAQRTPGVGQLSSSKRYQGFLSGYAPHPPGDNSFFSIPQFQHIFHTFVVKFICTNSAVHQTFCRSRCPFDKMFASIVPSTKHCAVQNVPSTMLSVDGLFLHIARCKEVFFVRTAAVRIAKNRLQGNKYNVSVQLLDSLIRRHSDKPKYSAFNPPPRHQSSGAITMGIA